MQKIQLDLSISCITSKQQYVGQTKRTILQRFQGHYYTINKALKHLCKNPQDNPNAHPHQLQDDTIRLHHIAKPTHKNIRDFKIQVTPLPSKQWEGPEMQTPKGETPDTYT